MSTAQPSKKPGVRPGGQQTVQPTVHKETGYQNKGVAPHKPRGMGC